MVSDESTGSIVVFRRRRFNGNIIILSLGSVPTCTSELIELLNRSTGISTIEANSNSNSTIENISQTLSDFSFNLPTLRCDDVVAFRHINGDLGYLYRPPVVCRYIKRPSRRLIRQPCWSRHRWKSLT